MPALNQPAPEFTLKNTRFEEVSLTQYRGHVVVIAFYPAAFTGVCQAELCTFQDMLADLNNLDAVVLGISGDSPYSNGAFAEKNAIEFDLLSDIPCSTRSDYGVVFENFAGIPGYSASQRAVFVVDREGQLTYSEVCEHPGLQPDYEALRKAVANA